MGFIRSFRALVVRLLEVESKMKSTTKQSELISLGYQQRSIKSQLDAFFKVYPVYKITALIHTQESPKGILVTHYIANIIPEECELILRYKYKTKLISNIQVEPLN